MRTYRKDGYELRICCAAAARSYKVELTLPSGRVKGRSADTAERAVEHLWRSPVSPPELYLWARQHAREFELAHLLVPVKLPRVRD